MSAEFTHGGIPAAEASHWDEYTYQLLGKAIEGILSHAPDLRRKGYSAFRALKREFMVEEWDEYLNRLDNYRRSRGAKPILAIIEEIGSELIKNGTPSPNPVSEPVPVLPPKMVAPALPSPVKPELPKQPIIEAEQLSLF